MYAQGAGGGSLQDAEGSCLLGSAIMGKACLTRFSQHVLRYKPCYARAWVSLVRMQSGSHFIQGKQGWLKSSFWWVSPSASLLSPHLPVKASMHLHTDICVQTLHCQVAPHPPLHTGTGADTLSNGSAKCCASHLKQRWKLSEIHSETLGKVL